MSSNIDPFVETNRKTGSGLNISSGWKGDQCMKAKTQFYTSICLFFILCSMCLGSSAFPREGEKIGPGVKEALDASPSGRTTVIVALAPP
ncbi:MAG TPA: hypothetical protein VNK81_03960, partial [Thermodesulfobacteriota bacterium]|nr:hypothetical protein [Thermodesulfobacteriota bacterium]